MTSLVVQWTHNRLQDNHVPNNKSILLYAKISHAISKIQICVNIKASILEEPF